MKLTRLGFLTSLLGGVLGRNLKLKPLPPTVGTPSEVYKLRALAVLAQYPWSHSQIRKEYENLPPRHDRTITWQKLGG